MTKIPLKEILASVDSNYRGLWDDIDNDQQKALKSEFWILNRYISNVKTSDREQEEHFVLTVNEYFNKHWFTIQKHPKLMWHLLCMCNYDGKKIFYHEYINLGKKKSNKRIKLLESVYPDMKHGDIEVLARISKNDDIKALAREFGWEEKDLKDL